jgi:phosphinothricin acetyltransferase
VLIRPCAREDLEAINAIYNGYVATSPATFDLEPLPMDRRVAWFEEHDADGPHRILVAEDDGHLLGWVSSSRLRPRPAYATSIETSVYVAPAAAGRGVGRALYEALFASLADLDLHRAYAGITMPNPASVRLHERVGFRQVALYTEQGRKFGRYWDVAWFERPL